MEDSGIDSSDKDIKQEIYMPPNSDSSSNEADADNFPTNPSMEPSETSQGFSRNRTNGCRALQKKLEMKVERVKRNYQQLQQSDGGVDWDVCITQPKSTNLIPISRLQYPGRPEHHTLIEYKELDGGMGEDVDADLGVDEAKFFANKHKKVIKQDLSDTFSIQEMTIESDSESGSDTLELLPPSDAQYWERLAGMLPCCAAKNL